MAKRVDRLDEYMKYKHLNDNKVTAQAGLSVGVIGKSRSDGRDLSDKAIEKIVKFYTDLNSEWLSSGVGEMIIPSPTHIGDNNVSADHNGQATVNYYASGDVAAMDSRIKELQAQVEDMKKQNNQLLTIIDNLTKKM